MATRKKTGRRGAATQAELVERAERAGAEAEAFAAPQAVRLVWRQLDQWTEGASVPGGLLVRSLSRSGGMAFVPGVGLLGQDAGELWSLVDARGFGGQR